MDIADGVDEIGHRNALPGHLGDVGSGKTLVAALAMARAAEAGLQSAMMAPTELLARQHGATLQPLLDAAGIKMAVLTGRDKAKDRKLILDGLASGEIGVVVGTHALFQDEVTFHDLGLIVIDKQHRFGVSDRMRMVAKGFAPHVPVLSATPIPRTLAMTYYADLAISTLDELPPGRTPVVTKLFADNRREQGVARPRAEVVQGRQVYWVCPTLPQPLIIYPQPYVRLGFSHSQPDANGDFYLEVTAQNEVMALPAT